MPRSRSCSIDDSWAAIRSRLAAIWASPRRTSSSISAVCTSRARTWASLASAAAKAASRSAARSRISALDLGQPLAQPPPVDQADLRAELLQPIGVFLVPPRLAGLGPHAAQAAFHLVDDVRQAQQVLFHPLQPPQGLELLELEAADAGGLFEDHAAVLGRRLQEHVDLALLDHAIGLRAQARARQQIADVAQPAGIVIDQILALAATIDPPRDLDLRRIDGQKAAGVVQRERDLGGVHSPAGGRAVENDVGHFFAAEALDALLAKDPLDGIDDVRLSRPVGTDDDGNPGGEFEPRPVGEALETGEFKRLEHERKRGVREGGKYSIVPRRRGDDEILSGQFQK